MGKLSRMGVSGSCLLALAVPALAAAHGRSATAVSERALTRIEARQIGPAHAAEHARQRRAERRARALTPAVRRRVRLTARRYARATADGPADSIGRWQPSPIQFPTWAINSVLLPTGKVLIWSRAPVDPATDERINESPVYVWDPAKSGSGAFQRLDAPGSIFCSGQSLLATGEVFVAGGTLEVPTAGAEFKGLDRAFTFDPWALAWKEQPPMRKGRWYPSQVMLADGRIAIVSGEDESGTEAINPDLEVFTPAAQRGGVGTMTRYASGERADVDFYPHLHLLPNGKVAMAASDAADSAVLDPAKLSGTGPSAWTSLPQMSEFFRGYAGSVLLPAGPSGSTRVAMIGGATTQPPDTTVDALATSEVIDLANPGAGWDQDAIPGLHRARWNHNVVMLPDGSLASVGGGAGERDTGPPSVGLNYTGGDQELKRIELLRPGVDSAWRLGPAQRKWRTYHSTALLMPDGRVLSAGDDYWDGGDAANPYDPADLAEIYEPPYLFDGNLPAPRPAITAAPGALRWGDDFGVSVGDTPGRRADRAVLVAPSATTHGTDMNQRHVELAVTARHPGRGLDLRAPAGPALAPPGFYMLFVLDESGTPSVARWVQLRADAADAPLLPALPAGGQVPPPAAAPPAAAATPVAPAASRDRHAPRTSLRVRRRGRTLRLRVGASEAATVTLAVSLRKRSWKRTLRLRSARTRRTVVLRLPAGWRGARLLVRATARDAAGNVSRRRIARTLRR